MKCWGTPGCGTADGAARRTRGTQTGSPRVPSRARVSASQLAGLRLSGKTQRPSQRQFGHETLVLAFALFALFALFAPAASRPGQHCAVRRQRGRQVAPCGHTSTVGQRFLRLVLRDDQQERRRIPMSGTGWANPCPYGSGTRDGGSNARRGARSLAGQSSIRWRATASSSHSRPLPATSGRCNAPERTWNGRASTGWAQSCHSSQCRVGVTRSRWPETSGYR
jgi:hypothetical protein